MRNYILLAILLAGIQMGATAQRLIKDIRPGTSGSALSNLTRMGNYVYFVANQPGAGVELWKTDGTEAGTVMVKDINPGAGDALYDALYEVMSTLVVMGNHLYFAADDGINGLELWKSDGTEAGTVMVKDVNAGNGQGVFNFRIFATSNAIYFMGQENFDWEVHKSDGTTAGTALLKDINPTGSSYPEGFFEYNGAVYFVATTDTEGNEIWKTDGTGAGTVLLKDLNAGPGGGTPFDYPTVYNGELYFRGNGGTGLELFKTNGTSAGTQIVKEVCPSTCAGDPQYLSVFNNKLFFTGYNGTVQMWSSDGTALGTSIFKELAPGQASVITEIVEYKGKGYFRGGSYNTNEGVELWATDGTPVNTVEFLDINNALVGSSTPHELTVAGDLLFFAADDGTNGTELWSTDGTTAGTIMYNVNPGGVQSDPREFVALGNKLLFTAIGDTTGRELYAIDNLPTGINEPINTLQFSIYPNPANNTLTVDALGAEHVAVYDLQGKLMAEQIPHTNETAVNISNLSPGMYLLKISNSSGQQGVSRFIKQ